MRMPSAILVMSIVIVSISSSAQMTPNCTMSYRKQGGLFKSSVEIENSSLITKNFTQCIDHFVSPLSTYVSSEFKIATVRYEIKDVVIDVWVQAPKVTKSRMVKRVQDGLVEMAYDKPVCYVEMNIPSLSFLLGAVSTKIPVNSNSLNDCWRQGLKAYSDEYSKTGTDPYAYIKYLTHINGLPEKFDFHIYNNLKDSAFKEKALPHFLE